MPIRIVRDNTPDGPRPDNGSDLPAIVVTPQNTEYEMQTDPDREQAKHLSAENNTPQIKDDTPKSTTWAMVGCRCTATGRTFQLTFRHENDQFTLKSIDRHISDAASKDAGTIKGPFEWGGFECPECHRGWTKEDDTAPAWPVIMCVCNSLFCTRKGVYSKKSKAGPEWWWRCPNCHIDALVGRLESLEGVAIKGK